MLITYYPYHAIPIILNIRPQLVIKISLFTLLQTKLFCNTVVYEKNVNEVSHVYELQKYCRSEMK